MVVPGGSEGSEQWGRVVSEALTDPAGCWGGFGESDWEKCSVGEPRPV